MRGYHQALLDQGVQSLSWDECWEGYRRAAFNGLLLNVAAGIVVVQTERGDRMFEACFTRMCQQVLDLGSLELLPEPDAGSPEPLAPEPADEGTHAPGPEPLWNESWYFDGVSDDGSLGVYTRTGRVPNQDACLYTTCICGPGRPTIMLTEASAPLPESTTRAGHPRGRARRRAALPGAPAAVPGDHAGHRAGLRRPRRDPARRARPRRGHRAGAGLRDRRHPLPVAPVHPLRDPLPGHRDRDG